jgi:hypothetical protein
MVGLESIAHVCNGDEIETGFLRCPRCGLTIPILGGFVFFTEPLARGTPPTVAMLEEMATRVFGSAAQFDDYRRDKRRRGVFEAYAAFAPFNESVRALEPVLPYAAGALREGDFILDAWNRSGWSGEWLAARFPRQRVLALWEGNSSVLGYRGFRRLLGSGQRAYNLDIAFCALDRPLPFRDDAFGLVHGYDCLHRYGLDPLAEECLRVARADAAIVFPHVHLGNSEPDPYFERGGVHRHGRDYLDWLGRALAGDSRRGVVLSEAALFDGPKIAELNDDPHTKHYNGFVALLPQAAQPPSMPEEARGSRRFVVSPLFRFNLARATAHVAPTLFDGAVGHLLPRHPVYRVRLPAAAVDLSGCDLLALLMAVGGWSEDKIETALASDAMPMRAALKKLADVELLRPAAISEAGHRLQRFHTNQLPVRDDGILGGFWSRIGACADALLILDDGGSFSGGELHRFAVSLGRVLHARGLEAGDGIAVQADAHPLLMSAAIAAASSGFDVRLSWAGSHANAGTRLFLCGDAGEAGAGIETVRLGLTGDAGSLLSLIDEQDDCEDTWHPDDAGWLEFDLREGRTRCRLADLVDGIESLSAQIEKSLRLLDGRSVFGDLLACLAAWCCGEAVRALDNNAPG